MPFPQQLRHERVSPSTVTETGCSLPVETMNKHMKSWLSSCARQTATAAILQQWQTEEASPSVTTDDSIRKPRVQQTPKRKRQSSLSREAMRAESIQGGEQRGGRAARRQCTGITLDRCSRFLRLCRKVASSESREGPGAGKGSPKYLMNRCMVPALTTV